MCYASIAVGFVVPIPTLPSLSFHELLLISWVHMTYGHSYACNLPLVFGDKWWCQCVLDTHYWIPIDNSLLLFLDAMVVWTISIIRLLIFHSFSQARNTRLLWHAFPSVEWFIVFAYFSWVSWPLVLDSVLHHGRSPLLIEGLIQSFIDYCWPFLLFIDWSCFGIEQYSVFLPHHLHTQHTFIIFMAFPSSSRVPLITRCPR